MGLILASCSQGSGSIGGKISSRTIGGGTSEAEDSNTKTGNSKPSTTKKETPKELGSEEGNLEPAPQQPSPNDPAPTNPEEVTIPGSITGAFLFCYRDKVEGAKATVYCATQDEKTKNYFEPSEKFGTYAFSATVPDGLTVTKKDLPIVHRYNVEFTIAANSADDLIAKQSGAKYLFNATDFDNKMVSLDARVTNNTRPQIFVQSLKPQNNQGFRCLDRYRMQAAQPIQVVTTPCGSNTITHDWFITTDKKIAHVRGECLAFDPSDGLSVVKPCDSAESPKFEFNGEEIRIQGSNNCLGLKNADNSGVDYSASVPCNGGDIQQHWSISAEAKAGVL